MSLPTWGLHVGHVLERLREMPDQTVHCCITSPPYFQLRDYHLPPSTWDDGWVGELGQEPTPEQYIAHLVEVFDEVGRVLRDDGTLWVVIGDNYARSAGARKGHFGRSAKRVGVPDGRDSRKVPDGLKEKDLIGIPYMLAFALRAAGWYWRSKVVWDKPNGMPESTKDRPTSVHEEILMFSKQPIYFYDGEAIKEPAIATSARDMQSVPYSAPGQPKQTGDRRLKQDGYTGDSASRRMSGFNARYEPVFERNKRNVWRVNTQPYPDAHFATFPAALIEPMVLAGAAPQTCGECGAPWRRLVEKHTMHASGSGRAGHVPDGKGIEHMDGSGDIRMGPVVTSRTVGWAATCAHEDASGRAVVLDPFAGSGTTLQVAIDRGRDAIGIELGEEYAELTRRRLVGVTSMLPGMS